VDIVWDVYKKDGLKASTRETRDCSFRRMVLPSAQLPGNWKGFLWDNDNKTHLFEFIAKYISEKQVGFIAKYISEKQESNSYHDWQQMYSAVHVISKILCIPAHMKKQM
jgi:hypothetical protein